MDLRKSSLPGPIFSQPFWLQAVAPDSWNRVNFSEAGQLVAHMPYAYRKHRGSIRIEMPPLTQTLGPWIKPFVGNEANRLSYEKRVMDKLIQQLPGFASFRQSFHHSVQNWLPFYWQGYHQTTRYTYVLEGLADLDKVWHSVKGSIRTDVRKARRTLVVRDDLDVDAFLDLNEMTFRRQSRPLPYSREMVRRLDHACRERDCRQVLFAEDGKGQLHAAAYIVWDENAAYYLMGGSDPALRSSAANTLLLWEAICFAATVTRSFDFEGSMIEPIERYFRAFGARQVPYFQITKMRSLPLAISGDVRRWFNIARRQSK